jgi:hypothetical protein
VAELLLLLLLQYWLQLQQCCFPSWLHAELQVLMLLLLLSH